MRKCPRFNSIPLIFVEFCRTILVSLGALKMFRKKISMPKKLKGGHLVSPGILKCTIWLCDLNYINCLFLYEQNIALYQIFDVFPSKFSYIRSFDVISEVKTSLGPKEAPIWVFSLWKNTWRFEVERLFMPFSDCLRYKWNKSLSEEILLFDWNGSYCLDQKNFEV